jgi:small conductance mechanosensitive channel
MLLLLEESDVLTLFDFVPLAITIPAVVFGLLLARKLSDQLERKLPGRRLGVQIFLFSLTLAGLVALILALPLPKELRGQLLTAFGILLSAAMALASTSFLGNLMAGLMLKAVRNFRTGDLIECEGRVGRITERGALHTEIQTEDRNLVTLPNLFLITHPTTVFRSSGTIVSASVSLGYDVGRGRAKELMLAAATEAGLADPFFQIVELGDFAVTYRVAGLLAEVKDLFSTRSRLKGKVLDALHEGGVEIVSPTFMNTRALGSRQHFVPPGGVRGAGSGDDLEHSTLEALAFDKAELAESVERFKTELEGLEDEREGLRKRLGESKDEAVQGALQDELDRLETRRERLDKVVSAREDYLTEHDA